MTLSGSESRQSGSELRNGCNGEVDRRRKAMQELYLDKVSGLIDTDAVF